MSTFDPSLLEEQIITEEGATKSVPIPEGEYLALIEDYKFDAVGDKKSPVLNVFWILFNAEVQLASVGLTEGKVRQTIWLDLTDTGALAFGPNQNLGLNRLREALDMNRAGVPFSFAKLKGAGPVKVTIGHRPDRDDPETKYSEVKKVSKAA